MMQAVYFKPPYEERNPELLIVKNKPPQLREVLSQKHEPLHKVLGSRPQTAHSQYSGASGYTPSQTSKKGFSMYSSAEKTRKIRMLNEQSRKSRVINEKIRQVNNQRGNSATQTSRFYQTTSEQHLCQGLDKEVLIEFVDREKYQLARGGGAEVVSYFEKEKAAEIDRVLDLQVQRGVVFDDQKHIVKIRGGTTQWRRDLRDYQDQRMVLVSTSQDRKNRQVEEFRKSMQGQFRPELREQQVQTIKSVLKPEYKDEQLSAIFQNESAIQKKR